MSASAECREIEAISSTATKKAGYRHIMNLAGSVFEWHSPLVINGEPGQSVHLYNRISGMLLESKK